MKPNTIFYIIIAGLLWLMFLQHGCYKTKLEKAETATSLLLIEKQTISKELNKKGDTITSQQSIIVQDQKAFSKYADSVFAVTKKMGATLAYYKLHVKTRIDSFETAYTIHDTVPQFITDTFARAHMMMVPAYFNADSQYYTIQGAVRKSGVAFYEVSLNDTFTARTVESKNKLFKASDIHFQVKNANPYVQITGMQSVIYKESKKSFWKRMLEYLLVFGTGVLCGALK